MTSTHGVTFFVTFSIKPQGTFPSSHVNLSVKLDDKNFKQWKQQIDGVIRGHKLQRFVTTPCVPPRFLPGSDPASNVVNSEYLDWEQQDALICTWLLSTIFDSLLTKLVDCTYSWQVWYAIHLYFNTLLTTKARQLRSELRNLTKGSRTIENFVLRVREINDSLISVGDPVPLRNLIEIVLDALPKEYDPIVAAVNRKDELCSIDELESFLLAHESRLEKNKKYVITEPVSVNLTQASSTSSQITSDTSGSASTPIFPSGTSHVTAHTESHGLHSRGGRPGRGGGPFGRGGGRFACVHCQICSKSGHDASV